MVNNLLLFTIIIALLFVGLQFLSKSRKKNNNISNEAGGANVETVLLSPWRALVVCFGLVFLGVICSLLINSSVSIEHGIVLKKGFVFFDILFLVASVTLLTTAIRLFIRSWHIVQIEITMQGLRYRGDIFLAEFGRGARMEGIKMFLGPQKFTFIEYTRIRSVDMLGDVIRICKKDNTSFILPFYFDNKEEISAVFEKLNNYVKMSNDA